MSFKLLQFSPQTSTRIVRVKALPVRWTSLDPSPGPDGFLNSLLEDEQEHGKSGSLINWGPTLGLILSIAVSGGFWAGVGLVVSRLAR